MVTKETIDYYLSKIEDEKQKKDLMTTISKFDIRISTKPVIDEEYDEFCYKIPEVKEFFLYLIVVPAYIGNRFIYQHG